MSSLGGLGGRRIGFSPTADLLSGGSRVRVRGWVKWQEGDANMDLLVRLTQEHHTSVGSLHLDAGEDSWAVDLNVADVSFHRGHASASATATVMTLGGESVEQEVPPQQVKLA
jgi:hypothetical protein